jgi:hypothetical protein
MDLRRDHLGTRFELRTDRWAWFWRLVDPPLNRGAAGAAATEADAVREACIAIEEIFPARRDSAALSMRAAAAASLDSSVPCGIYRECWDARLDRIAECLCICG